MSLSKGHIRVVKQVAGTIVLDHGYRRAARMRPTRVRQMKDGLARREHPDEVVLFRLLRWERARSALQRAEA